MLPLFWRFLMSRRILALLAFGLLSPGCVPVTDPVGDIDAAKPNKELIGTWKDDEPQPQLWVVDRPEVKGNPKGLMRARMIEKGRKLEDVPAKGMIWFFTATAGKELYMNTLELAEESSSGFPQSPNLGQEGGYAEWVRSPNRGFFVVRLSIKGPVATLDPGNHRAFVELMEKEKFPLTREFYKTGPGWLAKYLEKNGPKTIFDAGKAKKTLIRVTDKK
jgi:hypothetical protein